ncbi:MAG: polysaccharide deacetylase family protein [Clostridia bacterium]|nr:polysaccharide deacetylase family protein [Clostridia bacterium]
MRRALRCGAALLALLACLLPVSAEAGEESSIVYRAHANEAGKIALTFDDGPHPHYTHEILGILAEYDVRATFFVVGENVEFYPNVLAEVQAAGHEIGNHTYDHHRLGRVDTARVTDEILRTEQAVFELCDSRTKLFRPPEGMMNDAVIAAARALDYRVILWNIDTRDWDHPTPEAIAENILSHVKSGDIILMHDYIGRDSPTPAALRIVIPALLEAGYRFVGVSELIGSN